MADESPELIEQEMQATRQSLTGKVAALESTVMGTLQQAANVVQETVQTVKSAVTDTTDTVKQTVRGSVDSVSEGVKEMFDVKAHVQNNPLTSVGVAAAAGFVTGLLLFRKDGPPAAPAVSTGNGFASTAYTPSPPAAAPAPPPAGRPGWVDDLFEMFGAEAKKIGTQALTTLAASIRQSIDTEVPQMVNNVVHKVTAGTEPTYPPRQNGV